MAVISTSKLFSCISLGENSSLSHLPYDGRIDEFSGFCAEKENACLPILNQCRDLHE